MLIDKKDGGGNRRSYLSFEAEVRQQYFIEKRCVAASDY